jgi:hypothetical protein
MPIGTVDYTSTAPWNDPFNPWPKYSQITLSAADTFTPGGTDYIAPAGVIYDLQYFNPVIPTTYPNGGANACYYRNPGYSLVLFKDVEGGPQNWYLFDENDEVYYYQSTRTRKDVPYVNPGNVGSAWRAYGYGTKLSSLYIAPVTTSLTPWEYRRRRLLEYV